MRIGPGDIRLTTRFVPGEPWAAVRSTLHEVGHGIYDQNLPPAWFGTPSGDATSLGLHESQSRLVENLIGGSRGFWRFALPRLAAQVPALAAVTVDDLHAHHHRAAKTTVRIGADPLTYDLHIAVRVELERKLLRDRLRVADLPAAWDELYARRLVCDPRPGLGFLQDGHWAAGMFGYFPTYSLGNLIAAQLAAAATRDLGDLDELLAAGGAPTLMAWMAEHVHRHGSARSAAALVEAATGSPIGVTAQLARLAAIYGPSS